MENEVFDWDRSNLRKVRKHRITAEEVEQALSNDPILVYDQEVQGEIRFVYYGKTDDSRLLAVIVTERREKLRVITAYDLDASQRRDYARLRMEGN